MAKLVFVVLFCLINGNIIGQSIQLQEVRDLFLNSGKNPSLSEELHKKLSVSKSVPPVMRAYKGASEAMKAKQTSNVYKKYRYFTSGRDTLELAVKQDPFNFEIRFVRFLFQNNIPGFLLYDNREADKQFILSNAAMFLSSAVDKKFSIKVLKILNELPYLTATDKNKINNINDL